jgi:Neuraminidase (sialidase)
MWSKILVLGICIMAAAAYTAAQTTGPDWAKRVLQLPPGPDNPRNSECAFVTIRDGSILMVYSHFYGKSSNDYATANLSSRRSRDGGVTWTTADSIVVPNEGGMNVMSVSLLRLAGGRIALFYARKNAHADCIPMVRFSDDEAVTWSEPKPCITDEPGYYVLNNDRVIQLAGGRLLMPVSRHQTPTQPWQSRGRIFCYFSDDEGRTWNRGEEIPNPDTVMTQEPGVVELRDGRIMMFMRTDAGVQYLSYTMDKGMHWSPAQRSSIVSPVSPASIKRVPGSKTLVMLWNLNDGSDPELKGKRTPLAIAISRNEGRTWIKPRMLETDRDGWYCYTALHFTSEGHLLAGYCAGSQRKRTKLAQTDVSLIDLKKLYGRLVR